MEKECKICGKYFETDSMRRCCCDDCSTNYHKRKREYANAYIASKRRMNNLYEPKIIEKTCDGCGKKYKTISRLLISWHHDMEKKYFCTEQCRKRYIEANTYCSVCGKSMVGNNRFSLNNTTGVYYCSSECEKKGKWEAARKNGKIKICVYCGKEYIGQAKYFCCEDCHCKAIKEGWRSTKKISKEKLVS